MAEKLSLNNIAKIYQNFTKSYDLEHLLETVELMLSGFNIPILTEKEINLLLTKLNFSLSSKGTKYIKSSITHCYYSQYSENTLCSLKELFEIVANEYDTIIETIRDGIRSSLILLIKFIIVLILTFYNQNNIALNFLALVHNQSVNYINKLDMIKTIQC